MIFFKFSLNQRLIDQTKLIRDFIFLNYWLCEIILAVLKEMAPDITSETSKNNLGICQ